MFILENLLNGIEMIVSKKTLYLKYSDEELSKLQKILYNFNKYALFSLVSI